MTLPLRSDAHTGRVISDTSRTNTTQAINSEISAGADVVSAQVDTSLLTKEFALDHIAFMLAKSVLQQMTASIVQWINSGFQGSPAFVTDLEGFLLDVADQEAGRFIHGSELGFLCSPFELDVRIALALEYQKERDYLVQCTLSDVASNMEGFLAGNFADGGWASWFEVTANPENTPTGAYLSAKRELDARIVDAQGNEIKKLDFGDGFFSTTICEVIDGPGTTRENCSISTPGKVIQEQLTFTLSSGQQSLIQADEINEIIGALFAQLAQQAITGLNGLLGLSQGGYRGNQSQSYLDALITEEVFPEDSPAGLGAETLFEDALRSETLYLQAHVEIFEDSIAAEQRHETARTTFPGCYAVSVPSALEQHKQTASSTILTTIDTILDLEQLTADYYATSSIEARSGILSTFTAWQNSRLHNEVALAAIETGLRWETDDTIAILDARREAEIDRCVQQLN